MNSWLVRAYLWACELLYYQLARYYDHISWLVSAGAWQSWQQMMWEFVAGTEVLELGVGTGKMMKEGRRRGKRMVGIDRSPAMLEIAANNAHSSHSHANLAQACGQMLPFADAVFDTVCATFPAGYIIAVETLQEVRRVLRRQGRCVIVGFWVEMHMPLVARLLPIFYGRPRKEVLMQVEQQMALCGFNARWEPRRQGLFTVGILVAERMG